MAQNKLTDAKIKNLKPRDKRFSLSDGGGLFVEVMPGGSKVWRLRYRFGGRQEKATLGRYPAHGLTDARLWRDNCSAKIAKGISPMQEKQAAKATEGYPDTVREFAAIWMDEVVSRSNRNPGAIQRVLDKDVLPYIGSRRLESVTAKDVLDLTDRIKARGADHVALLSRNILKRMYGFAIARRKVERNPAAEVEAKYIAQQRSREVSLSAEDIGALLRGLYSSNLRKGYIYALHILLVCMVRKGDVVNAKWGELDLDDAVWEIPAERAKMGRAHVVYIPTQAVELFTALRRDAAGSPYVLPSRSSSNRPISPSTLNTAIRGLDLEVKGFVIHDFRRTASTHLNEALTDSGQPRFAPDWIEKALAHEQGGIRGVYNKAKYATQRKDMLQWWADFVDEQIYGDSDRGPSNVIAARFRLTEVR